MTQNGSGESEKGFLISSYRDWVADEQVPLHQDFAVDLRAADVTRWERFGVNGAVINVAGRGDYLDMWLLEIPPGGATVPQHHLFEAVAYVISGRGSTTVQAPDGERSFEWGPKSMFAIPLNAATTAAATPTASGWSRRTHRAPQTATPATMSTISSQVAAVCES